MAPSDSEPCTKRPAVDELLPAAAAACDAAVEERAPAAETSESDQAPAAEARPEPAEKKKQGGAGELNAAGGGGDCGELARRPAAAGGEESARDRLKRHRTEMAGRVRIPDMWGQERLLKDWVDCAVFDRPLAATTGLLNARQALVAECAAARRPAHGRPLRVQNGCS